MRSFWVGSLVLIASGLTACASGNSVTRPTAQRVGAADNEPQTGTIDANVELVRKAIARFFPDLPANPRDGSLYLLIGPDGSAEDAAFGALDSFDRLKARNTGLDKPGVSIEIVKLRPGEAIAKALTVALIRR